MIAQVKEALRQEGKLSEEIRTVFKVVKIDKDEDDLEIYRPAIVHDISIGESIIYTPDKTYRVGEYLDYPAFAFYSEEHARDFVHVCGASPELENFGVAACVVYQWAWLDRYYGVFNEHNVDVDKFWESALPFNKDWRDATDSARGRSLAYATHLTPIGTIGMFEFEMGELI